MENDNQPKNNPFILPILYILFSLPSYIAACLLSASSLPSITSAKAANPNTSHTPVLQTDDTVRVQIFHPAFNSRWSIRLPEAVATSNSLLFYSAASPGRITWGGHGRGEIGYEWE